MGDQSIPPRWYNEQPLDLDPYQDSSYLQPPVTYGRHAPGSQGYYQGYFPLLTNQEPGTAVDYSLFTSGPGDVENQLEDGVPPDPQNYYASQQQ